MDANAVSTFGFLSDNVVADICTRGFFVVGDVKELSIGNISVLSVFDTSDMYVNGRLDSGISSGSLLT